MEYKLSVLVLLSIFTALDFLILINYLRKDSGAGWKNPFTIFAVTVTLQQLFSVFTQLAEPEFNILGKYFTYFAYFGALIFMTFASYYLYRYLKFVIAREKKISALNYFLHVLPVILIVITCLASPFTHWVFYADENGVYQRGTLFFLQFLCPYIYIPLSFLLSAFKKTEQERANSRKMIRYFLFFLIPSMVGVCIQMFIVKGGYSAVGVSIGFVLMYLEIYIEDINENKRLKSIESLNIKLQQVNEEEKKRLQQISRLNNMLEERMSIIQSMNRVYFVSFYANLIDDSFIEISNTDFVKKYFPANCTASEGLELFCNKMVHPEFADKLREFCDFSTLDERMKNKDFITCDYLGNVAGWCQVYFIAGDRDENGSLETIFLAARTIHDEKKREFAQNKELDDARIAAEAASAAKTVFLSNMSHDIRTPLNAILGFSDLMVKNKDNPVIIEDYLGKIKSSGEYLLSIVNNILDMAKIESGQASIEREFADLKTEVTAQYNYIKGLVESSNHIFTMEENIQHRYVMLDPAKHQQILMNFVSNAIKYTPEGGSIHLQIDELPCERAGHGTYRMCVSDTGIGMSPEFLEHIFDSFSRERNTTDSKVIGTGLGMSIVKRLVDLIGAKIEVESEKGVGSKFTVTCDLEIVDNPEDYLKAAQPVDGDGGDISGKRILLTEDNELNAEIATAILEDMGAEIDRAENGVVCIEKLNAAEKGYYDLILMDIQMPLLDGYETTRRIRAQKYDIPIIAMTANAFREDREQARACGMNGHLAKPLDIAKIREAISAVLK